MRRLGLILGLLALWGCDDDAASGGQCVTHTACELPLSCLEGRCALECRRTPDCARGETCFENVCYAPVDHCRADFECAPGLNGDCNNPGNPDVDPQAPFDPFSKGKGKNKGKGKGTTTPSEPE